MELKLEFWAVFEEIAGCRNRAITIEETSIELAHVVELLGNEFGPAFAQALYRKDGKGFNPGVIVAINGKNILYSEGLETRVVEGDRISIGIISGGG